MNAQKTLRAIARPAIAVALLTALTVVLAGCDNDRHHRRHVQYYNQDGYYGDVVANAPRHDARPDRDRHEGSYALRRDAGDIEHQR